MSKARLFLTELFETRRIVALMMLGMGLSICQRQSQLVNALFPNEAGYGVGLVTLLCGFGMAWLPHRWFSGVFAIPMLLYSLLNVWYAIALNTWLPLGAVLSAGVFAIVWADMVKPVRIVYVQKKESLTMTTGNKPATSATGVWDVLLHSKRFRVFVIGLLSIFFTQVLPAAIPQLGWLSSKVDLISIIIASLVGLLITNYSYTDVRQESTDSQALTLADAIQGILMEIIQSIFSGPPASGAVGDSPLIARTVTKTSTLRRPDGSVLYVTVSTRPPETSVVQPVGVDSTPTPSA